MSKKKRKRRRSASTPPALPVEDRRAEAVTVGWMLCALLALCAQLVGLAVQVYLRWYPDVGEPLRPLALLPPVMLLVALVAGVLTLLLTPLVYRLRRTPPPSPITVVAVLIGMAPIATLLMKASR